MASFTGICIEQLTGRRPWLAPLPGVMAVTGVPPGVAYSVRPNILARVRMSMSASMASRQMWQTQGLPPGFFARRHPGGIANRFPTIDRWTGPLAAVLAPAGIGLATISGHGAVLLFIDRVLGATAASLLAPPVLSRPVRGLDRSGQRQVSGEARVQAATIQGLPTIAGVIRSIPAGMDTVPNDGAPALSGGHVRCPPIALVLAGRPRMPAMDGATGGLDTGARSIVSRDIDRPCIARAIVVHRLSTAVRSDKIHFLDRGRAAESGDAPSPIAADGRFVGSVKRQTLQGRALFPHLPVLRPDNSPIRKHDA